jgi:hypothetical protein
MTKSTEVKIRRKRRFYKPNSISFHPKSGITVRGNRVSTPENRYQVANPMIFINQGKDPLEQTKHGGL